MFSFNLRRAVVTGYSTITLGW